MKKNTLLYVLLVVLIAANGYFLYHQFGGKGKRGHDSERMRQGPVHFIADRLEFSDAQKQQLEEMNVTHKEKIKSISSEIRQLKDELFNNVSQEIVEQKRIDSILDEISIRERAKDTEVYFHLRGIRGICDDAQKEKFERIMKDVVHKRGERGRKGPPHGREH